MRVLFLSRVRWLLAATLVFTCARAQERPMVDPAIPLPEKLFPDLAQLLEVAIRQSPRAINSNLEYLIARENIGVQRSRMLPAVGGYMTYSFAQDRRLDRQDPVNAAKLAYSMVATQPVFHWGALEAATDYGKLTAKIAENNFAEVCRLLLLEVRSAYLRLIVLKAASIRANYAFRLARTELTQGEEQLKTGAIAPADIRIPQTQVQQTELDYERSLEEFRNARVTVERLTGSSPLNEASIPVLIPEVAYPKAQLTALAERFKAGDAGDENYRLVIAQLRVEQEKLNYKILDKALRPKFNVVAGVTQDEVSYTGSPADRARTQSFYGGVNVTWDVFDGFRTPTQRRASKLRLRQLQTERSDREREQDETVQSQMKQIDFAARSTALGEATLGLYNTFVSVKEADIKRGSSAPWEIESITIARDGVLIQAMANRSDLLARIADLLSTLGRDPALQNLVVPSK